MPLPSSGQISLNDVNVELKKTGTQIISLNDTDVRALFQKVTANSQISMSDGWGKSAVQEEIFSVPGIESEVTYTWVVPADVTSISVICVGGGGGGGIAYLDESQYPQPIFYYSAGGGGGGAVAWVNNIAVTPGESLTAVVGGRGSPGGGNGGISRLLRSTTVLCEAGGGFGSVDGIGGAGGTVGLGTGISGRAGRNGSANGVDVGFYNLTTAQMSGGGGGAGHNNSGATRAGSGGNLRYSHAASGGAYGGNGTAGGGGGTGLRQRVTTLADFGIDSTAEGPTVTGGERLPTNATDASNGNTSSGGFAGGGGGGTVNPFYYTARSSQGASGAVRIIWPGNLRLWPSTNVQNEAI